MSYSEFGQLTDRVANQVKQLAQSTSRLERTSAAFAGRFVYLPGFVTTSKTSEESQICPLKLGQALPVKTIERTPGRPNLVVWVMETGDYMLQFKDYVHGKLFVPQDVQQMAREAGQEVIKKDAVKTARTTDATLGKAIHSYANVICEYYEAAAGTPVTYAKPFVGKPPSSKKLTDFAMAQPEPLATAALMALSYFDEHIKEVDSPDARMVLFRSVVANCRTHIQQLRTRRSPSLAPAEEAGNQDTDQGGQTSAGANKKGKKAKKAKIDHKKQLRLQFRKKFGFRPSGEY